MKKLKNKFIASTLLFSFCFSLFLSLSPVKAPEAQAWDAAFGAVVDQGIMAMREMILGIVLAAAKQAAMEMILEEVNKLMDDTFGTGEKIIRDWNDYLITTPDRQSKKLMNDYLSNITQGRDSSRYRSMDISQIMSYSKNYEGFGGMSQYQFALIQKARADGDASGDSPDSSSYLSHLASIGRNIINSNDTTDPKLYDKKPGTMFDEKNFGNLSYYFASGSDPWSFANKISQKNYQTLSDQKDVARTEAQSSGFLGGKDENGQVTTPASTNEAITNKANTLGMDIMAKANSIPEVISAAVVSAISRSIKQGIGSIKDRAKRELSNVRQQITNNTNKSAQQIGPRAVFNNDKTY
jgi:hypothetical protein